jgi:Calx-beta domain/FG-GAP-like repeat/Carboxypeptidase regulatory-like domain
MRMTSWLDSFRASNRRTPSRRISRRRSGTQASRALQAIASRILVVEKLEDRTLLSGTTVSVALQQGVNNYSGMSNSYINGTSGATTTNYSTATTLFVNGKAGAEMDALLQWNLSAISAGSTLQTASLSFNVESASGSGPYSLYALTTPWTPGSVTFNQASASTAWQLPGAHGANDASPTALGTFNPSTIGQASITLNSAGIAVVQNWINNPSTNDGFILRSSSGEILMSSNLDSAPQNHPSLALTYTVPPIYVNAGPTEAVTQTSVLTLAGTVQDNDPGATQAVSSTWTMVSGPGTVTFENAGSPTSDAVFSTPGNYVLQLSATDGTVSGSSQVSVVVEPGAPELSPLVSAGANQTISVNQAATLAGQISQPGTKTITSQWSQLSGPGTAIFTSSTSPNSTAQFTAPGTYVLDLVASDGTLASNSTTTITVNPIGTTPTQPPPVASAGANQTVTLGSTVTLSGSVTYQTVTGATLSTVWQLAGGGPGTVTFGNSASPQTTATLSATGIYYLRLLATYDGVTDQSYTTITVNPVAGNTTTTLQQGVKSYAGGSSTYIDSSSPTTNYSTGTFTVVQNASDIDDALLMFNLSGTTVSGTVSAATLSLEPTSATTAAISVYALSTPWTASQATYKNATTSTTWQTPGALGSSDYSTTLLGTLPSGSKAGVDAITLTAAGVSVIQGWINNPSTNYGFILRGASGLTFIDSDANSTTSTRPILSITTTASGTPSQPPAVTNPVTSAQAAVNGSGGVSGYLSGVGLNLATLYFQYLQYQQSGSTSGFVPNLTQANISKEDVSGTNVAVFVNSQSTTVSQLQSSLQALGMQTTLTSGNLIGGWLPISQIQNAGLLHGLVSAIPSTIAKNASTNLGVVASPQNPSVVTAPIDPSQMRTAYGLNLLPDSGTGITIAIVDAFNDPTIVTDANAFNTAFSLPLFNSAGGPTLTVLGQTGTTTLPGNSPAGDDWSVEESLDVQWAHSIAPNANIVLYEANSDAGLDLYDTEATAAANPKVSVISNSWGGTEFSGEQSLDSIFTTPSGHQGITFLAATGDNGAPSGYPAYSPNVVAVGGTTLNITSTGAYEGETGWSGSAGGISQFEGIPGYQIGKINGLSSTNRANPDVSMDADPNTGVFVIDSTVTGNTTTFLQIGGTSLATPMWAGIVALADQVRTNANESTLDGPSQTLPRIYQLPSSDFHDITTGNNGFSAGPGYDLVTGIGSPVANLLVPDLAGVSAAPGPAVTLSIQGNPISENGGQATITATLSAATTEAVTVQLQFSGTAVLGTQYSVSSTEIVIPAGQTTGSISVTGINTNQNIGNQTIIATASSIQGGTAAGGSQSVTLVELENLSPQVTLTTSGGVGPGLNEFSENAGTVTITATLTQPVSSTITIALGFSGDALLGTDYKTTGQSISIMGGSTTGTITLTGLSDTRVGASAAIYVTIESITPSGLATTVVGSGTTTAYVVYNQVGNPLPFITITPTAPQVPDNGSVVVTFTRTNQFDGSSAIQLLFNPNGTDTAVLGTNYKVTDANGNSISNGGFIFIDGLSTTITISGIVDPLAAQPKLGFTIGLGEILDGALGTSTGSINGDVINSHPGVALSSSATSFAENGGTVTVTATLPYAVSTSTVIDLGYGGSAIANQDYTITNPGTVAGDSPVQIVIPAGQTTGSVVLTGASNPHTTGGESVILSITTINGAAPTAPQVLNLSIANQAPPTISIEDAAVVETGSAGTDANVVVRLSAASTSTVTVAYTTVNGSALAGVDYTTESGTLTFNPGTTSQTIAIPLLSDGAATGALQFSVALSSPMNGTLGTKTSATVTLVEPNPEINIEDTSVVDTGPTTAQVTLVLSQEMPVNVSVNYQTTGGTALANVNYIPESGTAVFPAGTTTYTIDIPILGDQQQNETENFLVQLSSPSVGTIVRSQAVVTLFDVQPGFSPPVGTGTTEPDQFDTASGATNITADTSASGPFAPADPSGAVGPNSLVVFDSDLYQVFNKSTGTVLQSSTLNTFWTNAGVSISTSDYVGQPHVVYDPATGHWYASALDQSVPPGSVGPAVLQNNLLLAVSKTSDPTQGWVGFEFATDPLNAGVRADFDSLGFSGSSVVVTANMYNITTGAFSNDAILSVPKADLTAASPTVARASTLFESVPPPQTINTFDPAVDYDAGGNEFLLAQSGAGPAIEVVSGGGGPTVSVSPPVTVGNATSTGIVMAAPVAAPQPAGAPPLTSGPKVQTVGGTGAQLDALSSNFTGTIVQVGGNLWAAQTVFNATTNTDAIQWFEIDVTPADMNYEKIIQHGVIADPNDSLFYYYPSLSVDTVGDVVIGFSGSSLVQDISSYAVYGTTTGGVTTFSNPFLLKQGTGIYAGFSEANVSSATISASSATFDTTGANNSATITVQLTTPAGSAGTVVDLGFSGTAIANNDYSISNGANSVVSAVGAPIELLIPAGQTSGSVVLTGLGNAAATADETLTVSVTSINGTAPAATTSTSLSLIDTTSTVQAPNGLPLISSENLTVVESASTSAQVLVRLSEPVLTSVTVDYSTANGSALAGIDYTAETGSVTFSPGQTVATISIPLINNGSEEGKSFLVNLSLPAGGRGSFQYITGAIVTLLTAYPTMTTGPMVALSGGGTFAEDGTTTTTVTATLTSAAPTGGSLLLLSFGGTATFGTQYVASSESIFIPAGQTTGLITLIGNNVPIGANNLSVVVGIQTSYGANPGAHPTTATATLTPGNVASSTISGTVTGNSGVGLAGVTVYLTTTPVSAYGTEGDFNPSVNLFTTTNASGNYSFTGLPAGTYTVRELIPSNELVTAPTGNTQTVPLTQAQSSTVNFTNALSAVWGAYSATALDPNNPGVFWTFQGFDDDQSGIDFNTWGVQATQLAVTNFTTGSDNGVNPETFNIPVTLTDSSTVLTRTGGIDVVRATIPVQSTATTIFISFSNGLTQDGFDLFNFDPTGTGTAIGGLDYDVFSSAANNSYFTTGAPVEFVIPAGQTTGTFDLEGLQGDSFSAATLQVSVEQVNLAPPAGATNTLPITIVNPVVSIENGVGFETGGSGFVTIPVRLSNPLPVADTVTFSTISIAAPTGTVPATTTEFTTETNQTVTFAPGQTEVPIEIPLSGTPIGEAAVFGVQINNVSIGSVAFQNNPSTAYILNAQPTLDAGPTVSFAATPATFTSLFGTATLTATLSAANLTQDTVIVLNYTSEGAVEGTDYTTTGDVIVIPKGNTTGLVTMTGNNENAGIFVVSTTAPQIFGASLGTPLPTLSFTETITASAAIAGGGVDIEGRVVDNNGNPMAGVYVYVGTPLGNDVFDPANAAYAGNFDENYYVVTDADGLYDFHNLPFFAPDAANYTVSELVPANYVETEPTGDQYTVGVTFSTTTGFTYHTHWVDGGASVSNVPPGEVPTDFVNSPPGPPSPTGAVGPNDVIEADNNDFIVYNKISGTVEAQMTLDQFWLQAWQLEAEDGNGLSIENSELGNFAVLMNAYEPQISYDPSSGRWYAVALDNSNPPYTPDDGTSNFQATNDILLAVSNNSNPLDGWVDFVLPADEALYGLNPDPLNINGEPDGRRPLRADAVTVGFNGSLNSTAVVLTANLYDADSGNSPVAGADSTSGDLVSTVLLTIPKEDLLSVAQTDGSLSQTLAFEAPVLNNFTSVSEGAWTYGINPQSVVSYDANSPALVLSNATNPFGATAPVLVNSVLSQDAFELTSILGSGTNFAISGSSTLIPLPVNYNPSSAAAWATLSMAAPQPNNAPSIAEGTEELNSASLNFGVPQNSALDPGLTHDGIDGRISNVVEVNGDLWVAMTVFDPTDAAANVSHDDIAWFEIKLNTSGGTVTGSVIQNGLIKNPNLWFYFPSIAVNASGDVVIGFDGSDSTTFISSYAAVGTTFNGVTTFTTPQLLKAGTGVYTGNGIGAEPGSIGPMAVPPAAGSPSGSTPPAQDGLGGAFDFSLWGAYSATVIDPSNPNAFWTFQGIADDQFSADTSTWGVQATRITTDAPSVTLSVSEPPTVTTPLRIGILGDNLSAGDISGTTPGWVSQLTSSGDFLVPTGGAQAVDGALAAGLASQLPEETSLAPTLNYTTIIVGDNDALALANGTETTTQYITTIESNVENAINAFLQNPNDPNNHLILGTVPDIFVTPEVQALSLSAATITADKTAIQTANAAISAYAVEHGIPVVDLYAFYQTLLGSGSLAIGGTTFSGTSSKTDTTPLWGTDGFTPASIAQGLIANMIIEAADFGYAAGLTPISDQTLVKSSGGIVTTVTNPTYFNVAPYVLASDANPAVDTETITATLSQASAHDVVVNLYFSGSSQNTDYFTTSQQIVIPAGQTSGSITLTGLGEPSALVVVGVNSLEGAVESSPQQVTAILTNPPSIVTLSSSPSTFMPNSGAAVVTATLSAPSAKPTVVYLTYSETGGPGVAGTIPSDIVVSSESIYIPAGQTSGSVTISGDGVVLSASETITVTMASVVGAYSQVPQQITVTQVPSPPTGATISGVVDESTAGNPAMAGVTVYLVVGSGGSATFNPSLDPFTTTNSGGVFAFTGLQPGTYTVYEVVPNGFNESAPASGSFSETLTTGQQLTGLTFTNTPAPANSNPPVSLSLSAQTVASNGGSAVLTVQAVNSPTSTASVVIRVGGIAPLADFKIVGPSGPVSLTSSDTFTATIPVGQTSVSYTITANQDSSATLETVDCDIVSVTNATVTGTQEAELGITNANGGGTSLVVNTPTQVSGTTGSGLSFSSTPVYNTAGDQPDFITQAQLTGNGVLDFIVCNGGTNTVSVILNPTSGNPTTETYTVAGTPTGAVAADFNGDGNLDIAVATSNGVTILLNNGSGGFTVGGTWTAGTNPSAITAGVFNSSGFMDLAVANAGSNNVSIFYGYGNGTFQNAVNVAVGSDPVDIKAANLTNTSVTDLVVANHGSGDNTVSVLINNGSGTFTQTKYTAGIQPNSIAIGDFTGSGVLDIAVANVGFNPSMSGMINTVSILMGNGSGSFTPVSVPVSGQPLPANVYAAGPSVDTITAGDVNGDGKLDLIVANNGIGTNEVTVLLNNGSGTFAAPVALSVGTNPIPVSVVTGDYFGNGSIDIAAASDWGTGGVDGVTILQNQTIYNSLAFHVYLSHPATSTVVVKYATANGTAVAGTDYLSRSGTLIFAPGQVEETVYVPVLASAGTNKTVVLQLSSATNAPILIGTGLGTINPIAPAAVQATVTVSSGKLTITDPSQNDVIKVNQLASGVEEVMVNNEVVGVYTGVSGTIAATTTNGADQFVIDEEVTLPGVITDPAMSNPADDDFVFAELANGASWTIQI